MKQEYVLQMLGIEKEYYGNKVLKGVNINVMPGEVVALVGENGAGKSTLMNILFGMPVIHNSGGFQGKILFEGKEVDISSPDRAMKLGIGMVHQEFMLLPGFTVTENIKLNREITKPNIFSHLTKGALNLLDTKAMEDDTEKALNKLGMQIDVRKKIAGMSVGFMQFVEIAREIDKENMKLIVFDEPTAVLTETEAERLLKTIEILSSSGIAVIFVSHKLEEVIKASHSIVIMRDGETVAAKLAEETDVLELSKLMVGRSIDVGSMAEKRELPDDITLSIKNFAVAMPGEKVKDVTIDIKRGEIFGFAGLSGQGKTGIANGLMGLYPTAGEVIYEGKLFSCKKPKEALSHGIGFVSENRREVGLLLDDSIEHNIMLSAMIVNNKYLKKFGFFTQIDSKAVRQTANKMVEEFKIKCRSIAQNTRALSGGNQQKVCLARALAFEPKLLLVSEPTRGIDIGAKRLILDYLVKLNREKGMTIIITSSELQELRSVCDRIAVIAGGRVEGILMPDAADEEFGLMMTGEYNKLYNRELSYGAN